MADEFDQQPSAVIEVEVIHCASRSLVDSRLLRLPAGATVDDAVQASGILLRHPEIDAATRRVGIWSQPVPGQQTLRDGDRVEIYRALLVEPKEARRLRQRRQSLRRALNSG